MFKDLKPAFNKNNIALAFAIKDSWAKYLAVVIQSIVDNSSNKNNYDIVIIANNLKEYNKNILLKNNLKNFSVRIIDITEFLKKYNMNEFFVHHVWGIEMYYRVFLPEIMHNYDKVLYCDADILLQDDIANLYNANLGDAEIGVCRTIRQIMSYHAEKDDKYYFDNVLKLNDINDYFNSGVLLMNLDLMRKTDMINRFIKTMKSIKYLMAPDQDVFNVLYNNEKKVFLGMKWNHLYYDDATLEKGKKDIRSDIFEEYKQAMQNPSLIHFAGELKPWFDSAYVHGPLYWKCARKTDYYEEILLTSIRRFANRAVKAANYKCLKKKAFKYKLMSFLAFDKDKKTRYSTYRRILKHEMRVLKAEMPAVAELFINKK